jgi:hypothetical protein
MKEPQEFLFDPLARARRYLRNSPRRRPSAVEVRSRRSSSSRSAEAFAAMG